MKKVSVLGIQVSPVDLEGAVASIVEAGRDRRALGVSALAVHGLMTAKQDAELRARINSLELVVPDGQPVRWALKWLRNIEDSERVAGPDLMNRVCQEAAASGLPVYLYGSTPQTIALLRERLAESHPELRIAGDQPSRFRMVSEDERVADVQRIVESGARIVLVGLGCPRQEIWTYENRHDLAMPVLAVGAAFDYHAGLLERAPMWMQRSGLEWLYRLRQEPRRLWRRYAILNPLFLVHLFLHKVGLSRDEAEVAVLPTPVRPG